MKTKLILFGLIFLSSLVFFGQAPQKFNYQGIARSSGGTPLASAAIGLRLTVHDGSQMGTVVYMETHATTTNAYGLFTVAVGTGTVLTGNFSNINWASGAKYLEVELDPNGGSSYTSLGSNQLLSVPYALYSNTTNSLPVIGTPGTYGSKTKIPSFTTDAYGRVIAASDSTFNVPTVAGRTNYVSKFTGPNAIGISSIYDNGSTVGINDTVPTNMAKLHVRGVGTYSVAPYYQAGIVADGGTSSVSATGIYGEAGWKGVYGRNPGTVAGVEAIGVAGKCEGSTYTGSGYGVKGEAIGTGGTVNYGVYGSAAGSGGGTNYGTYGTAGGSGYGIGGVITGTGAAGYFDGGSNGYGVLVKAGRSGFGTITPTNMAMMHVSGVGTYSVAPFYQAGIVADGGSSFGSATGIYGEAGWRGIYGRNTGASGGSDAIGVQGRLETGNSYTNGYGIKGEAFATGPTNYGVFGNASGATTNNYGVYGTNSGTGYAGYFSGNVRITGSITKGSGTFLIDHPLDPANKYLYHSFVESPDMLNIYNGNIVTDNSGNATITLPTYFEALNKDFKYQLTVMGVFAQAIVADKIANNQFSIKTDKPNVEVSWQVTGVRKDKYAEAHRVVPEVEKEERYKGYYLHAKEWGMPENKSIDYLTTPKEKEGNRK